MSFQVLRNLEYFSHELCIVLFYNTNLLVTLVPFRKVWDSRFSQTSSEANFSPRGQA